MVRAGIDEARRILTALDGQLEPVRVGGLYRLGMAVVAFAMVLLPLVYVALMAAAAFAVYFHSVHHLSIFEEGGGFAAILGYFGPIVIGVILLLFMIKPLFAPKPRESRPVSLTPEQEPLLFGFVQRAAALVGAPVPAGIDVTCDVNASASFRRGFWSMAGQDLVLTIGLPLVAGLSLRQFAAVLAHELGHFAQGSGMRLTYIVRTVSAWFARVAYERDAWDQQLEDASTHVDIWTGIVLHLARFSVWLTRRVLWVLMCIGHLVSCFMLRQMEYDADRYGARLSGSETSAETVRRLPLLMAAYQWALADLQNSWMEKRLGDDLPSLVMANVDQVPEAYRAMLENHLATARTGPLDTHPSDRDRIESAAREGSVGLFEQGVPDADRIGGRPAGDLFSDFAAVSRRTSLVFYADTLGQRIDPSALASTEEVVAAGKALEEEVKAAGRFFHGMFDPTRPSGVDFDALSGPARDDDVQALRNARAKVDEGLVRANLIYRELVQADEKIEEARHSRALIRAMLKTKANEFGLPKADLDSAEKAMVDATAASDAIGRKLAPFAEANRARLETGARLALKSASKGERERAAKECAAWRALEGARDDVESLRHTFVESSVLLGNLEGSDEQQQPLIDAVLANARTLARELNALRGRLGDTPYPFEHTRADASFGEALIEKVPQCEDVPTLHTTTSDALVGLYRILARLAGRMALRAEAAEAQIGLEPLPVPPAPERVNDFETVSGRI